MVEEIDFNTLLTEVSEDELVASLCRDSFYQFFLEFWETIEAVELVPNWHIRYLCDQLQEVYTTWEANTGPARRSHERATWYFQVNHRHPALPGLAVAEKT